MSKVFCSCPVLKGNEGDNGDENDKRIVSRLVKEKEDEQSFGESSQIEEVNKLSLSWRFK